MDKKTSPWEHHPDLTEDHLRVMASVLRHVHDEALADYEPEKGDTPWGLGVKAFDRSRSIVLRLADHLDWLKIIDESKHLIFQIGSVPARFCRADEDGRPNDNMLWRDENEFEHHQQAYLNFPDGPTAQEMERFWRFVIHKDLDTLSVTGVDLVWVNDGGVVFFRWPIPCEDDISGLLGGSYVPESPVDVPPVTFHIKPQEEESGE